MLRKKYDDIHKMTVEKELALQMLVKGVQKITEEEKQVEKDTGGAMVETHGAMAEQEQVNFEHETQQLYKFQYQHMLRRMKRDLIALQLQSNDLVSSLHSKNQIYKEESVKQRISRE